MSDMPGLDFNLGEMADTIRDTTQRFATDKIAPKDKIVRDRAKLELAELESYPKTTGGDGMHIFVPLAPHYTYDQVRSLAEVLAR